MTASSAETHLTAVLHKLAGPTATPRSDQLDAAWALPAPAAGPGPEVGQAAPGVVARKLATIVLPSVSFAGVELGRVLTALGAAATAADPTNEGRRGVNLVLANPGGETATVTITFSEAVTGFTNADLTIANGTLSITAPTNTVDGTYSGTVTFNIIGS